MLMRIVSRIDQSSFDASTIGSARCPPRYEQSPSDFFLTSVAIDVIPQPEFGISKAARI